MSEKQCKEFDLENLSETDRIIYDTVCATTGDNDYAKGLIKTSSQEEYGNGTKYYRRINDKRGGFTPPSPGRSDSIYSDLERLIHKIESSYEIDCLFAQSEL